MNLITVIILACALIAAAVFTVRRFTKGNSCCGEHARAEKRLRSSDRSAKPNRIRYGIGGMVCGNCARKVENALNAMPGVKARVSISTKTAVVDFAETVDPEQIKRAIIACGYSAAELPDDR